MQRRTFSSVSAELAGARGNARRSLAEERLRVSQVRRIAELPRQTDGVLRVRLGHLGDEPIRTRA